MVALALVSIAVSERVVGSWRFRMSGCFSVCIRKENRRRAIGFCEQIGLWSFFPWRGEYVLVVYLCGHVRHKREQGFLSFGVFGVVGSCPYHKDEMLLEAGLLFD